MTTIDYYQLHFFTEHLIKEAGELVKRRLANQLTIQTKEHEYDFVTNIDKEIEAFLVKKVKECYPTHRIISEEGYGDQVNDLTGVIWGIDPIDGTANMVYQQQDFAIAIGIYEDGIGQLAYIYDVMAGNCYSAMSGQGAYENGLKLAPRPDRLLVDSLLYTRWMYLAENRYNLRQLISESRSLGHMPCASLGFVELGKGRIDGMLGKGNMAFWDIAAGKLFAEEAGVVFQEVDGSPYSLGSDRDMIGSGPLLGQELLNRLGET